MPTVFRRDPENMNHLLRDVHPDCQWVLDGEGLATRKYDGTCVMLDEHGKWWTRREVKPGKVAPPGFISVDQDIVTDKVMGWEPAEQSGYWKIMKTLPVIRDGAEGNLDPGTFELLGEKINGNPEKLNGHGIVRHAYAEVFTGVPRDYDGLAEWLAAHLAYEGIVFHHEDGRMAKIKTRDVMDG